MENPTCHVCGAPHGEALYRSTAGRSLTSLCQIHPMATVVHACNACGHAQSNAISSIDSFYEAEYDILVDSEEEDQIYEVRDGKPIFRTAHQARTLREKLSLPAGADVLDFGCAKSSTLRVLCQSGADITPHLFDVSDRYIPFWRQFARPENWAVHATLPAWHARFDLVTSFFSLEHIPTPAATLRHIASLLKPGGIFYGVVPNVATNVADFIVLDHCNHFTRPSLTCLFAEAGLALRDLDDSAHRGAFVVVAEKPARDSTPATAPGATDVEQTIAELRNIAAFWQGAAERVRACEADLARGERIAVYGAGFYGAFILSALAEPDRVACHLDQNPFLQGKRFHGRPVLPPAALPDGIRGVLVGLNPAHARKVVADIPALADRDLRLYYL